MKTDEKIDKKKQLIIESVKTEFEKFKTLNRHNHQLETGIHADESKLFSAFAFCLYEKSIVSNYETISSSDFIRDDITDGSEDKGIDFCRIDEDSESIYIGQNYFSEKWGKKETKSQKINDLIVGVSRLLEKKNENLTGALKEKSTDLNMAIQENRISAIVIMYTHNAFTSDKVKSELLAATRDIKRSVYSRYPNCNIEIKHEEIGLDKIHELYKKTSSIEIEDKITLPKIDSYLEERGENWKSVVISVPGEWIAKLHHDYGKKLSKANFREYMGENRGAEKKINSQIKETAINNPRDFWAFNNGITAVVQTIEKDKNNTPVSISGISVVNGAQTAGSLFNAYEAGLSNMPKVIMPKVMLRIVECEEEMINKIAEYNNTQNIIHPYDRYSKEGNQGSLYKQFEKYGIYYIYRRSDDKNPKNLKIKIRIPDMAKILCAFHFGDIQIPIRQPKKLFDDIDIYKKIFPLDKIHADHCVFVYTLFQALSRYKGDLNKKSLLNSLTDEEKITHKIFMHPAAKFFIIHIVGKMIGDIYDGTIPDKFLISPHKCNNTIYYEMIESWFVFVEGIMPSIVDYMKEYAAEKKIENWEYDIPRSKDDTSAVCKKSEVVFRQNKKHHLFYQGIANLIKLQNS